MMVKFTKADVRKLAFMCKSRKEACDSVQEDKLSSDFEKVMAEHEAEYMASLYFKLTAVANSDAKRVEIVNGWRV